jgi:very-short-patch-repair endonuclease
LTVCATRSEKSRVDIAEQQAYNCITVYWRTVESENKVSQAEEDLAFQVRAMQLPEADREYAFAKPRRWRFDFAWPDFMVAVEIEGGTWQVSRHTHPSGYAADMEKYNAAAVQGWMVLRFTPQQVTDGYAVKFIQDALKVSV